MRYRPNWGLLTFGALIVVMLFAYPTWRKLIVIRGGSVADFSDATSNQQSALVQIRRTQGPNAAATAWTLFKTAVPAPTSDFSTPNGGVFQAVRGGDFIEIDAIRTAKGRAAIYRSSSDNSLVLRFDEFSVTNGPGLAIYLCVGATPKTPDEVRQGPYFRVSTLKGTAGNQNYQLPPELRLDRYRSVVIFSEDFNLVYSSATLN